MSILLSKHYSINSPTTKIIISGFNRGWWAETSIFFSELLWVTEMRYHFYASCLIFGVPGTAISFPVLF